MPDICIFYSKPDKKKVGSLASILKKLGWSVWWAEDIKGGRWGPEIERNIEFSRCVIPIWNSNAIRKSISAGVTYPEAELSRTKLKPMITLISEEGVAPPFPFNTEQITANIAGWDCSDRADCVSKIVESVESVLGIAPKKWEGERPSMINLRGKLVKLPCFVKSLSSHETQLDPEAGLTVLNLYPEVDALLVSAYDMYLPYDASKKKIKVHNFMCKTLQKFEEKGTLVLLDSGKYEKSKKNDKTWTRKLFDSVLEIAPCTYSFCFDNLKPKSDPVENAIDVISRVEGEHEDFLIPVLHAPKNKIGVPNHELLPDIFFEYSTRKMSPIIAVPERELGEGICKKAETVARIRQKLNSLGYYQPIHILGTGNPLSILILATAGADLFDGLEWCRTVADRDTGFLFHHQQFDFFKPQSIRNARYQIVREAMDEHGSTLIFKMALHNLDFFYVWMEDLQHAIIKKNISEMITYHAAFRTQDFVNELSKLIPGVFK